MEPPSGYEHLPIMNKVKRWGNFFLSNLLEDIVERPNPSNSFDHVSNNFSIGMGRDELFDYYNESSFKVNVQNFKDTGDHYSTKILILLVTFREAKKVSNQTHPILWHRKDG